MLCSTTFLFIFCLIETTLHIFKYPKYAYENVQQERVKLIQTILNLKKNGLKAYPRLSPEFIRSQSQKEDELFLSNIGNVFIIGNEEDDGRLITKTDKYGFRNPVDIYDKHSNFDIFLLGESHTAGDEVPDGYTPSDLLRKKINYLVYNAGMGGSGLLHQMAIFLKYGLPKKPKNVVLTIVEGLTLNRGYKELSDNHLVHWINNFKPDYSNIDLSIDSNKKDHLLKDATLELSSNYELSLLTHTNNDPPHLRLPSHWPYLHNSFRIFRFLNLYFAKSSEFEGYPACLKIQEGKKLISGIFHNIKTMVSTYDGHFTVVYLPSSRWLYPKNQWPECEREMISSTSKEMDIMYLDLVEKFSNLNNPKDLYAHVHFFIHLNNSYGHLNRAGYDFATNQLISFLSSNPNSKKQ